jgi:serine/threonine protein kinase
MTDRDENAGALPDEDLTHAQAPTSPTAGTIGPYRLLQQVGEGGMGIVWLAEQIRPVRRQVALKVIKVGMDTAQVVARRRRRTVAPGKLPHHQRHLWRHPSAHTSCAEAPR